MPTINRQGWLTTIERAGNRLPDPAYLFVIGTVLIILCAELAVWMNWQIAKPNADGD